MEKQTYPVLGMHCASCASIIKRKLEKLEGVKSCSVNYGTEKARVEYDPQKVDITKMNREIDKYGYSLVSNNTGMQHSSHDGHDMMTPISSDETIKKQKLKELQTLKNQVVTVIPMIFASVFAMVWEIGAEPLRLWQKMPETLMQFFHHLFPVLATYTLFVIGLPYLKAVVRFVKHKVANMDTLVGIGTFVAFFYSFVVTAFEEPLASIVNTQQNYYDVTIVVVGFITLGKYLEARSKLKTGEAIEKLLTLQSKQATVLRNGKEVDIPIDQVVVGDIFIVKPGQKISTDGMIVEGSSSIDESMISGEAMPVDKKYNDTVIGGTVNKQGSLKVRATKVGSETMLAQIIKMVEEAQGSKAPIERLADKISAVFVPLVLVFAVTVLVIWMTIGSQFIPLSQAFTLGLLAFVGVLVIACPCAMGLATPTAIIVGIGKGAQNGILIKNAESLEKFNSVNFIVIDKTGTITKGKPEVTDIKTAGNYSEKNILEIIASLEKYSEHPLAQAIVEKAKEKKISQVDVDNFKAIEGKGVEGMIKGRTYYAGNLKLASDLKHKAEEKIIEVFGKQGKTPIIVMTGEEIVGYVGVADTVKEDSRQAIEELHKEGIKVAILTGDSKKTAQYIAEKVNIDRVMAEVLPADKANEIKKLQEEGYAVAMVGDGINDAPALAVSDVGVAMGTGTDVAIESADITLLGGQISKLPKAVKLSKATMRVIKQNLFWAFFYNIIGIPIAAGLLYPLFGIMLSPVIAGGAMAFSSVSVVLNSLRLKTVRIN